jgi:hypothetical protein
MNRKKIPHSFIFDALMPLEVRLKSMFGLWAVYLDEKIMLILRDRGDYTTANGIWIATDQKHHQSLKEEFPSLTSISTYSKGIKETEWQVLPVSSDDFELSVLKVCELIKQHDPRIGRVPVPRQNKKRIRNE